VEEPDVGLVGAVGGEVGTVAAEMAERIAG
jgi:hypothetical protein